MKNIFKFAAMAFAAVVLAGGATSCDPMDKDDDQKEQTGGNTNTPSGDNEGSTNTPATLSIDGKQWVTEMEGMGLFIDLGVKDSGIIYSGYVDLETYESLQALSLGEYTIEATDATSGAINIPGQDSLTGEEAILVFKYTELTASSVKIDMGIAYGQPSIDENIQYADFTLANKVINFEDGYENQ